MRSARSRRAASSVDWRAGSRKRPEAIGHARDESGCAAGWRRCRAASRRNSPAPGQSGRCGAPPSARRPAPRPRRGRAGRRNATGRRRTGRRTTRRRGAPGPFVAGQHGVAQAAFPPDAIAGLHHAASTGRRASSAYRLSHEGGILRTLFRGVAFPSLVALLPRGGYNPQQSIPGLPSRSTRHCPRRQAPSVAPVSGKDRG